MPQRDGWDPAQYERFSAERRQPFSDLVSLCEPVPGGTVVDLGCGTGELTAELHRTLEAAKTIGIDSSPAMLEEAHRRVPPTTGLIFDEADIASWNGGPVDVVFANASLHWVADHRALLARLRANLRAGGQLAFQVPANFSHPSHVVAHEIAGQAEFARHWKGDPPEDRGRAILSPAQYAELLFDLGAERQLVRLQVYGHVLESTDEVVQWVMGTLLAPYRARLDEPTFAAFVERYREQLRAVLGDHHPYFYTFPRILSWSRF